MSYILDALRKAERESKFGQAPTLQSLSAQQVLPQRVVWPWWLIAGLVILAAAVLVAIQSWQPQPLKVTNKPVSEITTIPLQVSAKELPAAANKPLLTESVAPQLSVSETPQARLHNKPLATLPLTTNSPVSVPSPVVTTPAPVTVAAQPLDIAAPPVIQALPEQFQRTVGALNLDIHIYSEVAGQRFVLINGKRYQQADWLQEGPLLEAITKDGVILSHQGQRFRLVVQR